MPISGQEASSTASSDAKSKFGARSLRGSFLASLGLLALGMFSPSAQAATILDGAEIYSKDTVRYGRWEIRMQVAAASGSVSSFFTYHNDSYLGLPEPWREIDIEILGKKPLGFQSNLITGDASDKTTSEKFHNTTDDLSKGYHTYVLEWTPDSIVWRLDGKLIRKTNVNAQVTDLRDHAETYRMNLWASSAVAWVGELDKAKLPIIQSVNWMRYSSYTPGSGPEGADYTPQWVDDFTTWNIKRWGKADWTFDENLADFTPSNAVVKNGYLMLILSDKNWSGTLTPPEDPEGNKFPTSVQPNRAGLQSSVRSLKGSLEISLSQPSSVVVRDLKGRVLASQAGSDRYRFHQLPEGMVLVDLGSGESSLHFVR